MPRRAARAAAPAPGRAAPAPGRAARADASGSLWARLAAAERELAAALERERRWRAIGESSIEGVMTFDAVRDADGRVVDFEWTWSNAAAARVVGPPVEWYPGRRMLEALPGNRPSGLFDAYVGVMETGEPWSRELRYRYDGIDGWVRLVAIRAGGGLAVSFDDLTARRDAEDARRLAEAARDATEHHFRSALRRSDERYAALADSVPMPVWSTDATGRVDHLNRRWTEYTGQPAEDGCGDGWAAMVHPDDREGVAAIWAAAIADGSAYVAEYRLRAADGSYRWYQSRATAQRGASGAVERWYGTCIDVHDAHRARDALERTSERLREADRRKDRFLAILSHELRNPFAPIRNAARVLATEGATDAQRHWARDVIARQVAHVSLLLDDLLDLARIKQGKLALRREAVALREVVDAAVEVARPLIAARGHALRITLPEPPPRLEADPLRLSQVLANLLTNAAKYTDPGGHIALTAAVDAGTLRIAVRDDGIGLPADESARIFEMFSQVESASGRADGGLGIGLALVRGLVELHGGRVSVRSGGPGLGSEFVVALPMRAGVGSA